MHGAAAFAFVTHVSRDGAAPVAALSDVTGMLDDVRHQLVEQTRRGARSDRSLGLSGETVARQGRHDDSERILEVTTMLVGMGELLDDMQEFEHRSGPAMTEDERLGRSSSTLHVVEVQVDVLDLGDEL